MKIVFIYDNNLHIVSHFRTRHYRNYNQLIGYAKTTGYMIIKDRYYLKFKNNIKFEEIL